MKPTAILVTGAPGSGKTTLARTLSQHLRVPHLARDDVRAGLFFSSGGWAAAPERIPSAAESVETFLRIAETHLDRGVSCVLEYVFRRDRPEDLEVILERAEARVLITLHEQAIDRFAERNRRDPLLNRAEVLATLGFDSIESHTAAAISRMERVEREMMSSFELPTLTVATSGDYDPPIETIVDFVTSPRNTVGDR